MVAGDAQTAVALTLSPDHVRSALDGRKLLNRLAKPSTRALLIMGWVYEDDETRRLIHDRGFMPRVPPGRNRVTHQEYARKFCKRHNEVGRLFGRLKSFRRSFSRFDKSDVIFPLHCFRAYRRFIAIAFARPA